MVAEIGEAKAAQSLDSALEMKVIEASEMTVLPRTMQRPADFIGIIKAYA